MPKLTRVLLVEDEPDAARLARLQLEMPADGDTDGSEFHCCVYGSFEVTWVSSLSAAADHLRHNPCDCVLLDLVLPEGSNETCVHIVREAAPDVPIVVHSGVDDADLVKRLLAGSVAQYILKGTVHGNLKLKEIVCRALESGCVMREMKALQDAGQWDGRERRQSE